MGLFSRRRKSDDQDPASQPEDQPAPQSIEPGELPVDPAEPKGEDAAAAPTDQDAVGDPAARTADPGADAAAATTQGTGPGAEAPQTEEVADAAASIGISMSSFRGLGVPGTPDGPPVTQPKPAQPRPQGVPEQRQRGPAQAPAPTETVAGLRDNVLLRDALAQLGEPPAPADLMNVVRQLLQGHVFLRVKGDARALLSEGKSLPLAVVSHNEKQYVLVYSGGVALQAAVRADGDTATSAVGQPVLTVINHVLGGTYEGIVIDGASGPARAVIPRPLLQRAIDEADATLRVKTLLAGERQADTAAAVVAALADAPLWVAVRKPDEGSAVGVAETRTTDGQRYLEVFSHPLEMLALGRGDQALPIDATKLAAALTRDAGLTGVIVDPAGPWIRLTKTDLAPLL